MNDGPILGKIIPNDERRRDAIHIAVAPVVADCALAPGEHIGLIRDDDFELVGRAAEEKIGIVDPFLTQEVQKGERFWMFLYPNTVTGMRHVWSHPAFQWKARGK